MALNYFCYCFASAAGAAMYTVHNLSNTFGTVNFYYIGDYYNTYSNGFLRNARVIFKSLLITQKIVNHNKKVSVFTASILKIKRWLERPYASKRYIGCII